MDWQAQSAKPILDPTTLLGALVLALICIGAACLSSWLLGKALRKSVWMTERLGRRLDATVVNYVLRLKTILVFLGASLVYVGLIPSLRGIFSTLLASAGVTALIFGFAAKSTLSNLISGLALAAYRPFRIGDQILIENQVGTVEDITLRHTIMRTWRRERLIIPNEKIDNMSLINYTLIDPKLICDVELGVSYDTDLDLARRLILEEAAKCPHLLREPEEPWVRVIGHRDFAIALRLYAWVARKEEDWLAKWWLLENIKNRFDREGVEIPFPYRTLVYKKDLPLPGGPAE